MCVFVFRFVWFVFFMSICLAILPCKHTFFFFLWVCVCVYLCVWCVCVRVGTVHPHLCTSAIPPRPHKASIPPLGSTELIFYQVTKHSPDDSDISLFLAWRSKTCLQTARKTFSVEGLHVPQRPFLSDSGSVGRATTILSQGNCPSVLAFVYSLCGCESRIRLLLQCLDSKLRRI